MLVRPVSRARSRFAFRIGKSALKPCCRSAGSSGEATRPGRGRGERVRVRREGRAQDDGYRSALVADVLQQMGYSNVWSMAGGWKAWKDSGAPVEMGPDHAAK